MTTNKSYIAILFLLVFTGCSTTNNTDKIVTTGTGLKYSILKNGNGEIAKTGDEVAVYESMSLSGGKLIYSIAKPAPPIKFVIGKKQATEGVEQGVTGMEEGEIRKLIVPPSLSKRKDYPDYLSPDSTLIYEIELVEITKIINQ
ncbi:MAG: FKBP-type peptidyl-prolyl cis-trans isomerase [Chitinophagaceae bacterium]|nr:FKBP-type peptidyl-prolyl cis-trans isomerase [Chitinophagaceae bacterium]